MTFAIAHREPDGTAVLDLVREFTPPFGIENTVAEIASIAKAYRLPHVWGDAYAGEFAREPFRRNQVIYKLSEKRKNHFDKETQYSKSEIYRDTLPLFNTGKVRWLDNRRLVNQLCSLERQTARGTGRESIDNPRKPGAHDDLANAACGALVFAESKRPLYVHPSVLARSYGAGRSWS